MERYDNKNLLNDRSLERARRIPYRLMDFYEYVCSGDRPNGGEYYLGFLNNEEWQLQIYTGRTQVNFCKKGPDGMYNSMANLVFDTDTKEVRFAKVDSHGRADYDHMIPYSMSIELERINWNTALGAIGPTIRSAIEVILINR